MSSKSIAGYVVADAIPLENKIKLEFKLLTYDIETLHLKARIWRPGDQVVRHDQLLPNAKKFRIATITYKWWDEDKVHTLTCKEDGSNQKEMVAKFDEEIKKATVVIGKNNISFDDKHINTIRLLEDGSPMPEWAYKSDDVEKQIRKYFNFPSFSLDYLSDIFGLGGKVKMERNDWICIEDLIDLRKLQKIFPKASTKQLDLFCMLYFNKTKDETITKGKDAFNKMIFYNQKDSTDTEALLNKIMPHVQLKNNAAKCVNQYSKPFSSPNSCTTCGSNNTVPARTEDNKIVTVFRGQTMRVEFYCNNHKGYAGSRAAHRDVHKCLRYTGKMTK